MNLFEMTCAILSAAAYKTKVAPENQVDAAPGATILPGSLGYQSFGGLSGFEASAYDFQGKIVIAYAGTNTEQPADLLADLAIGLGFVHPQLLQAAEFYLSIKNNPAYAGREIVFAGHSLGGGLAAAMGVFFDKQAVTFDPAPFRMAVTQQSATEVKAYLARSHPEWPVDADLASFTTIEGPVAASVPATSAALAFALLLINPALSARVFSLPYPTTIRGEENIKAYSVSGEFLTNGYMGLGSADLNALRIQSAGHPESIEVNPTGASLGQFDLHSMTLLIAAAKEPRLATLLNDNSYLTEALFDKGLYSHKGSEPISDFLATLVQQEFSGASSAEGTGNLAKYADDLERLVATADGMASQPAVQKALVVAAMEYYYFNGATETSALFTSSGSGIHFSFDEIDAPLGTLKSPRRLVDALRPFLSTSEWETVGYKFDTFNAWHVQSGEAGMVWTASAESNDVAVGGAQTDILDAGAGDDILMGGAGQDFLTGGAGDDTLLGGQGDDWLYGGDGYDTYVLNGHDTIIDADGQGRIKDAAGRILSGAIERGTDGSYAFLGDSTISVSKSENDLTLTLVDGSSITIQGFTDGMLDLRVADVTDDTTVVINGDKDLGPDTAHPLRDEWGNPAGNATPNSEDILSGSDGNDRIDGLGGRDQIRGRVGDDIIEGGAAADIVAAGAGNDQLFGSVEIDLLQAIANGNAQSGTGLKGDWLNGGDGDDIVVASADDDALFGGHGSDILIGGAGDDVLNGDDDYTAISFDWAISDYGNLFDRWYSLIMIESAPAGAADELYGGAGNDFLAGGFGDDHLYGGDGNDSIGGNDNDDVVYGGSGNDYLTGDYGQLAYDSGYGAVVQGNDYLDGGDGDDWMQGESGNDQLYGGAGNDLIWGDATYAGVVDGSDYLDGEDGNDQLVAGGGDDDLFGGAGDDTLFGDAGADYLDGEDGSDGLVGGDGNDTLFGGANNDSLWGDSDASGTGADYLDGEDGDDILMGYGGADTLEGGLGKDTLLGGNGDDQLSGDDGDDQLAGEAGDDFLVGGDGKDVIRGDDGNDIAYGDGGADVLYGLAGADVLDGGDGNDEVQGGDANDTLFGGADDDFVVGQLGGDVLDGGSGNDEVQGNEGNDTVGGGSGNDTLFGLTGNDVVSGGDGVDYVDGGDGNDSLYGGSDNDWLLGGIGNDTLDGGAGDDLLSGDSGIDTYVFGRGSGHDVIENYDISYGASDALRFTADVLPAEVLAQRSGNDLVLTIGDTGDSVTIKNQFLATRSTYNYYTGYTYYYDYTIGSIQFADGTTWSGNSIPLYLSSASGSGALYGSNYTDVFGGANGGQTLYSGGSGSDRYNVGSRSGLVSISDYGPSTDVDVLTLSADISSSEALLRRVNADLVLRFQDSPDQVTVSGYFSGYGIERIVFQGDGTTWARSAIAQRFLLVTEQDDQVIGTTGDNVFNGLGGNDSIDGGAGNDVLDGGVGNDVLLGGVGNDSYLFGQGSGSDTITGEDGASGSLDAVVMKAGVAPADVAVRRDGEDLLLSINTTTDSLRISGYFHDYGGATVVGTVEQIQFSDGTSWDSTVIRSKLPPQATGGSDAIYGYETDDSLSGLGGDDTIFAGGGNDTLDGGAGNDSLQGGSGINTYLFGLGSGMDTIDAIDNLSIPMENTVRLGAGFTPQQLAVYRSGNDLVLFMPGGADQLTVRRQSYYDNQYYGIDQIIFDDGTTWDRDMIGSRTVYGLVQGTQGADSMVGTSGVDVLYGYGGNDTLNGGAGADMMNGGTGDDSYVVDSAGDTVVEAAGQGIDSVQSSLTHTLSTNVENLTLSGFSAIDGIGNALDNALTGNGAANTLTGLAGNDTLDGAAGLDTLIGGLGDDTYLVDSTTDVITENAGEGIDTVRSTATITLVANVENLVLSGSAAISGTGNNLANTLTGNAANNMLDGGTGADTLQGAAGDDVYVVENAGDVIVEALNDGSDSVQSSLSYTLASNVENLTLTGTAAINATGNGLDNVLTGNSANNVLTGGLGNDTYVITSGDTIVENSNEGIDTVSVDFTYSLGSTLENLVLTGTGKINGTGNALDNRLIGNAAINLLTGGAGNDTLDGGAGKDTMVGGTGDDYYVADLSTDVITENANEGVDTVQTAFTYTLGANLENLVLAPGAAINGTGNALNNVVTGNELSNVLDGGAGIDTLLGGAGDDTYVLDNAGDVVTESANEGIDTVQVAFAYALGANVENLTLTGTSALNGTGNALNNVLTGNTAANVLAGGAGDDSYVVGAGDTVIESANEGTDTVQSSVTYSLGSNLENLTLTGATAINGTGNALNNVITGNSATNVLTGGAGNDTYVVGTGDTVVENANEGVDAVQSSVAFTLSANVENLTLTGLSAINGTGNALDNVLIGNSAANVLSGGAGNDLYILDAGDSAVESANAGIDTVQSSANFTLGANVENLTLAGTSAINGSGNALNNTVLGNAGNNVLDGGAGQDYLAGGAGDDTYILDDIGDVVIENVGEGNDTVQTTVSFTAGGNVENVTLLGATAINATGDAGNNVLIGNSAANVLSGGVGNDTLNGNGGVDTLIGGVGDDTYVIAVSGATIVESAGEGVDTVQAAVNFVLGSNVENLTLSGTANINGTGNSLANIITGNSGNNVLDAAGGADRIYGGDGNDTLIGALGATLIGGTGDDLYILNGMNGDLVNYSAAFETVGGGGIDTIQTDGSTSMYDYQYYDNTTGYHWAGTIENATLTGSANGEVRGNDLDNTLRGNAGNNYLFGFWGNDVLYGNDGNDTLSGYYGNDTLDGGAGDDILDDRDYPYGADMLIGGAGNDQLYSYGGDTCIGGTGDDKYFLYDSIGTLTENAGEGVDTIFAAAGYTLSANFENLTLQTSGTGTGNTANNVLTGLYGADTLSGLAGDDTLDGGAGSDSLIGGIGNDSYVVDDVGDVVVENLGEGVDTVQAALSYTLGVNVENLTLTGTAALNATGNALNNVLTGNSANNVLTGGLGNDTYVITSGDTIVENAGEGIDTVQVGFTYTMGTNLENLTLIGTTSINGTGNALANVLTGNMGNNVLDGGAAVDTMSGGLGNDTYVVDNVADVVVENASEGIDSVQSSATYTLSANVENLTLTGSSAINGTGNALANVLTGNSAANLLSGSLGDDTYVISDTLDSLLENINEGIDTVQSAVTYTLGANLENLVLTGSASINGYGNALGNALTGNGGINTLAGGLGDDTYFLDDPQDTIAENANEGTDTVNAATTYALTANVENLVLTGVAYGGTGNALANSITGNIYQNLLDGGAGADSMFGGKGDDTYVVDNAGDVVTEATNEGEDTVKSSVGYTLGANVENLTLTGTAAINGGGNALNNTLTGNSGANALAGGAGDDTYVVGAGDTVTESANEGVDTVQSSISFTLSANLENLTLTGTAAINGTGNSVDNALIGNIASNLLTGGAGNDTYVIGAGDTVVENVGEGIDTVESSVTHTLGANVENLTLMDAGGVISGTGNALNNVLTGNAFANVLSGGVGNDTYVIGDGDTVVENANEGIDTVMASVTTFLASNVENLVLTGAAAINATGNTLDNTLTGNAANNIIDGQGGDDQMAGGAGNDIYWVDSAGDLVTENASEGNDTVQSFIDLTLGANIESLALNGVQAITGTGNELSNTLTGSTADNVLVGLGGDDTLDGRLGADTMAGGLGNDTYVVDSNGDSIVEYANEGTDVVQSKIDYLLGDNLENLMLLGVAAVHGTGNSGNNVLVGSVADNVLDGGVGADTMNGGRGNDAYVVDNVGDIVAENADEGIDSVTSSVSYTLASDVENLTLTGSGAINGVGNASDNVIIGNSASNTLSGGGGNNYLDGGAGADLLIGGSGNDIYVVDDVGDVVQDASGGYDTVRSSVSFALGSGQEELALTGENAIDGGGNQGANVLVGNMASNVLDGGLLADTMLGGAGDDTYVVDDTADWVGEYANEGVDTVRSVVSYALGVNLENLVLTGSGAIDGTDNALDNVLIGNGAANRLSAGLGNDTLFGGAGADTLTTTAGANVIVGGSGNDSLLAGGGSDVIAFNRDDGVDMMTVRGGASTLSLGGGVDYSDMCFSLAGNDLIFGLGGGDQIVLKEWYAATPQRGVANLQVVAQGMNGYNPSGGDPLRDNVIEQFDFAGLVNRFDQARAVDPAISSWSLASALGDFHVSGSDTTAIGGQVVLSYGLNSQAPVVGRDSTLSAAMMTVSGAGVQGLTLDGAPANTLEMAFAEPLPFDQSQPLSAAPRLDPTQAAMVDGAAYVSPQVQDDLGHLSIDSALHTVGITAGAGMSSMGMGQSAEVVQAESFSMRVDSGDISSPPLSLQATSATPDSAIPAIVDGSSANDLRSAAGLSLDGSVGDPSIGNARTEPPGATTPSSEARATNVADTVNARIDRVFDQWMQAKSDGSSGMRLSHYGEVLAGVSDEAKPPASDTNGGSSYSNRWQRLRFLLDRHMGPAGADSSGDLGAAMSSDTLGWSIGDSSSATAKVGPRAFGAVAPLPVFNGLQDGISRL